MTLVHNHNIVLFEKNKRRHLRIMSIKVFLSAFNIDDSKMKWGVRSLFLILSALLTLALLFPLGDPDLSMVFNWYNDFLMGKADVNQLDYNTLIGNLIYTFSIQVLNYLCISLALCTGAVFIYNRRKDKSPELKKRVIKNTIILHLFLIVVFPLIYTIIADMYIIFSLVAAFICLIACSYMSGDCGFGSSFPNAAKLFKKNIVTCLVNFILVFGVFYFIGYGIDIIEEGHAYTTVVYPLRAIFQVYKCLVIGRLMGTVYLDAKE